MLIAKLIIALILGSIVLIWLLNDKQNEPVKPVKKQTLQGFINSQINNKIN